MGQLQVANVSKTLGGHKVIDRVSFTVEDGEFFVLLGPSGCGKSTLLRLICGLENADSGQIFSNGVDITGFAPRERNLGMVFQDYGLYPNMNVYQNIAYGLEARGVNRAEIERRVPAAAEKLGLSALLRQNITELSGGEQQRVALARALVKDADAYLYDEPLSNLDPKLRHKARIDIVTVHNLKRKPSVYVTHDQSEAFAMADRIAILSNGVMQQIGTAEELLTAPVNTFVAGFLGAPPINLIDGLLSTHDGGLYFAADGFSVPLTEAWYHRLGGYNKDRVIAGIRPSALTLSAGNGAVCGEVAFVELLLGEIVVGVQVSERTNVVASLVDSVAINEGERIALDVDSDQLLLFDPDTSRAIGS